MFGEKHQKPAFFNAPVVCDVTPDAINNAFEHLNAQLNDAVAPVVQNNFDPETAKPLKIKCGETGPVTVECDDPTDYTQDESSGILAGSAYQSIFMHYDGSKMYATRSISSTKGQLDIFLIDSDTNLPSSTTPQGSVSSTSLDDPVDHGAANTLGTLVWMLESPNVLVIVDVSSDTIPTVRGTLTLSESPGGGHESIWTSDDYIFLSVGTGVTNDVLIIDASDPDNPAEVGAIASADTALTSIRGLEMTSDEQSLFVCGGTGVESWDVSDRTAPTRTASITGSRTWITMAIAPDESWLFVAVRANNTNIAFTTFDINASGVISENTSGFITTTGFTTTLAGNGPLKSVGNVDAATMYFQGSAFTNGLVVVFDLSDLTAPLLHETFQPTDASTNSRFATVKTPSKRGQPILDNLIWHQQDLEAVIEVYEPVKTFSKIPCQLEIGRIKITLDTLPCATVAWLTGIPSGGPTITNLDADLLDGEHGSFYSKTTHTHKLDDLSDVTLSSSPSDGEPLVYDTSTSKWIDGLVDSAFFTGTDWTDLTDAGATTLHKHDHGGMDGLTDDDHAQYALLAGRSGGQTLIGGSGAGQDLELSSTSHTTKGTVIFNDSPDFSDLIVYNLRGESDVIVGMEISNTSTDSAHDIRIGAGAVGDQGKASPVIYPCPLMIKQIDATWAEGTNQGGDVTGGVVADTVYYIWVIVDDTDPTNIDYMFDTAILGTGAPMGWSSVRRIGAVFTNAAANIRPFHQDGDFFEFANPITDVNDTTLTNNTWETGIFSVPPEMTGLFRIFSDSDAASFHTASMRRTGSSWSVNQSVGGGSTLGSAQTPNVLRPTVVCVVDQSRQADYIQNITGTGTNVEIEIYTLGYWDHRGRHSDRTTG